MPIMTQVGSYEPNDDPSLDELEVVSESAVIRGIRRALHRPDLTGEDRKVFCDALERLGERGAA